MKDQNYDPVAAALKLLCQTDDQFKIDVGFRELKDLADAGDMRATAIFGYASQFEHLGHYDLDACKVYLERSNDADDPWGQFYLGSMLFYGEAPFEEDRIYGNSLIVKAAKAGNPLAEEFMEGRYRQVSFEELQKLFTKPWWRRLLDGLKHPFEYEDDE